MSFRSSPTTLWNTRNKWTATSVRLLFAGSSLPLTACTRVITLDPRKQVDSDGWSTVW